MKGVSRLHSHEGETLRVLQSKNAHEIPDCKDRQLTFIHWVLGKVAPHERCYRHHNDGVGVHGLLPRTALGDVGQLLWFSCVLLVGLGASTQPSNQTTEGRLLLFI